MVSGAPMSSRFCLLPNFSIMNIERKGVRNMPTPIEAIIVDTSEGFMGTGESGARRRGRVGALQPARQPRQNVIEAPVEHRSENIRSRMRMTISIIPTAHGSDVLPRGRAGRTRILSFLRRVHIAHGECATCRFSVRLFGSFTSRAFYIDVVV